MEKDLDLKTLWQMFLKRWYLIVFLPLLPALVSTLISIHFTIPLYSTSTKLLVNRPAESIELGWGDIRLVRQLAETYSEIIQSRRILEIVIDEAGLTYSVDQLRSQVEVRAVEDTELIIVRVTDPDPERAAAIANGIASVFKAQIIDIMNVENVSVVDEALVPGGPFNIRVNRNVSFAYLAGLMVAFGLVFLLDYLDQSIKDPAEIQALLDLPVIGIVPRVEGKGLFVMSDPRSPPAEAFRTLRTNIQHASLDDQVKGILVAGANPQCGKSTIAANLALTLAQSGDTVLLVDADLRRPSLHSIFDLANDAGLSSLIIKKDLQFAKVVRKSSYHELYILTSGPIPPYPAEMLASRKMNKLNEYFNQQFDYVVYDSPPIIAVTDAAFLSRLVDGTLLVLDHGRVKRKEATEALEQLQKVRASMIGVVINGMPKSKSYYSGYQYYYGASNISRSERRKAQKNKKSNSV